MGHFGDSGTQVWISNCRLELTQSRQNAAKGSVMVVLGAQENRVVMPRIGSSDNLGYHRFLFEPRYCLPLQGSPWKESP
ncbi:hypothetical protein [Pseudomonas sp. MPB23]|jgi:hypothetical protein|uniref:hypothetical protein n=1 Tax=Pseudomonas sp. MPB23 TaxID=3388490 RepID=UPI003984E302